MNDFLLGMLIGIFIMSVGFYCGYMVKQGELR
jgi:hypothetical protein